MANPNSGRFCWHELVTTDVAAAMKFYTGLFGWSVIENPMPGGGTYRMMRHGDVMVGGTVGEVVQSNAKQYKPGDIVVSDFAFGWQEYAAVPAAGVRRVDPALAPLPYWMEAFGLNGLTAYFALLEAALKAPDITFTVIDRADGKAKGHLRMM